MTKSAPPTQPLNHYVTQAQLAEVLRISERSLARMRSDGIGPIFRKAGRRVLYKMEDVEVWLNSRCFSSTAEAKEAGLR